MRAAAITVAAYVAASRHDIDGTTEVAALVVLAAGVLAGLGMLRLASAIITIEILVLLEKSRLHALVRRIDDLELRAAVRFAVMAVVVLPLLPTGSYGPWGGVRPRELWLLVLFFSGLSFLGQLLGRVVGPGRGYVVGGALGGLASSTNVTFTFARLSRADPASARALAIGAVCANAVLYPRVFVALAVMNAALIPAVAPYLIAPALAGRHRRGHRRVDAHPSMRTPSRQSRHEIRFSCWPRCRWRPCFSSSSSSSTPRARDLARQAS